MRKSQLKQFMLVMLLGPFGLFYTSVRAALFITFLSLLAVYISPEFLLFLLAVSIVTSMVAGAMLVSKYNRRCTRDFQLSSYAGNVSYKVLRCESADRDYHPILKKIRRRKAFYKAEVATLAVLCIVCGGMILMPHVRGIASTEASGHFALEDSGNVHGVNLTADPEWQHQRGVNSVSIALKSRDYLSGSDGPFRPEIQLSCQENMFTANFNVDEILGTEYTTLKIGLDGDELIKEEWALDDSYRSASPPSVPELMGRLQRAKAVSLSYLPFGNTVEKSTVFDLTGSRKVITAFQNECGSDFLVDSV